MKLYIKFRKGRTVNLFCRVKKIKNKDNTIRYNFYVCYRYREKWLSGDVISKDKFILSLKSDKKKYIHADDLEKIIIEKLSKLSKENELEFNSKDITKELIKLIDTTTKM